MNTVLLAFNPTDLITPEPGLVIWMVIVFAILWFILGKFAFGPIANALKEREVSIEESLRQAEKARAEMAALVAKNEDLLNQAKEERNQILKDAKDAGERLREDLKERARKEGEKMIEDAKREIETQKQAALVEVKNTVGLIALDIAEKLVRKDLKGNTEHQELVKKLVQETSLN